MLFPDRGKGGACTVVLPLREGLFVAQGYRLTQACLSFPNFPGSFVVCCFVHVKTRLPGMVSGDRRRRREERKLLSPLLFVFGDH